MVGPGFDLMVCTVSPPSPTPDGRVVVLTPMETRLVEVDPEGVRAPGLLLITAVVMALFKLFNDIPPSDRELEHFLWLLDKWDRDSCS